MIDFRIAQWQQLNLLYLPVYVAMEAGLLRRHGLRASLVFSGNDDRTYADVAAGRAEFGIGDPVFCLQGKRGAPFKTMLLATIARRAGLWGVTHNPVIQPVRVLSDLAGLRVGCYPAPSTSHTLLFALKNSNKRLLSGMQIVETPIGNQCEAVLEGKADIALHIEPYVSLAEQRGWRRVYSFSQVHGELLFSALYVHAEWARDNPKVVKGVLAALGSALQLLIERPDVALKVARKFFPDFPDGLLQTAIRQHLKSRIWSLTPEIIPEQLRQSISLHRQCGRTLRTDWESCII